MKQTAVEWLEKEIFRNYKFLLQKVDCSRLQESIEQAKEMEKQQQGYSEEDVDVLVDMLQKCKEYFLLKTDAKSEERADAIGQAIEDFNNLKKNKL
jgi:hypothetical protein